jgi:hypothetical protein
MEAGVGAYWYQDIGLDVKVISVERYGSSGDIVIS